MHQKTLVLAVLTLALSGTAFAQGMAQGNGYMHSSSFDDNGGPVGSVYHSQKVVYHIDEPTKFKLLLGNVQNQINAFKGLDADLEIIVVANGQGYGFLLSEGNSLNIDNPWASKVQDLAAQGVVFEICNNTMNGNNIQKTDLLPVVSIVPAAVATMTELQMRGYAYLRP